MKKHGAVMCQVDPKQEKILKVASGRLISPSIEGPIDLVGHMKLREQKHAAARRGHKMGILPPLHNPILYNAASVGFAAGSYAGKMIGSAPAFDFTDIVAEAQSFGYAMDQAIPPGNYDSNAADCLTSLVANVFANGYITGVPGSIFTDIIDPLATYWNLLVSTFAPLPPVPGPAPVYSQAAPLAPGAAYAMGPLDSIVYVSAGSTVTLPAAPILGYEYLVKIAAGVAETAPVTIIAPGGYRAEDPGAGSPYVYAFDVTTASMKTSAMCSGWSVDSSHSFNLTR